MCPEAAQHCALHPTGGGPAGDGTRAPGRATAAADDGTGPWVHSPGVTDASRTETGLRHRCTRRIEQTAPRLSAGLLCPGHLRDDHCSRSGPGPAANIAFEACHITWKCRAPGSRMGDLRYQRGPHQPHQGCTAGEATFGRLGCPRPAHRPPQCCRQQAPWCTGPRRGPARHGTAPWDHDKCVQALVHSSGALVHWHWTLSPVRGVRYAKARPIPAHRLAMKKAATCAAWRVGKRPRGRYCTRVRS